MIRVGQPLMVGFIVDWFSNREIADVSPATAYWAVFGLCATSVVYVIGKHHWFFVMQRYGELTTIN